MAIQHAVLRIVLLVKVRFISGVRDVRVFQSTVERCLIGRQVVLVRPIVVFLLGWHFEFWGFHNLRLPVILSSWNSSSRRNDSPSNSTNCCLSATVTLVTFSHSMLRYRQGSFEFMLTLRN
uniref:Putative secreted protein n=1 Tax=Anopheles triannulatus TaxID=58253 RepID=A0A2M4B4A1_9DIPT